MKRIALVALMVLSAIAAPFAMSAAELDKADVCHKGKVINVSGNAVAAHLAHGDTAGVCPAP